MKRYANHVFCFWLYSAVLLFAGACDDMDGPSQNKVPSGEKKTLYGNFIITLKAPQDSKAGLTLVSGKLYDGPLLSPFILEETDKSGDCRLLEPRIPVCEQACGPDSQCVDDNECKSHPSVIDVGPVQFDGLFATNGESSFTVEPVAGNYQNPGEIVLKYPAFEEEDEITVSARAGLSSSGFNLIAKGIRVLEVLNDKIVLADNQPVLLKWSEPRQPADSRIIVKIDISHHGGFKGLIECDAPDNGSLEVSASLVDQLKALGISGFPTINLTRKSTGNSKSNHVRLIIQSSVKLPLYIPGLISCFKDEECPGTQRCEPDLMKCF